MEPITNLHLPNNTYGQLCPNLARVVSGEGEEMPVVSYKCNIVRYPVTTFPFDVDNS